MEYEALSTFALTLLGSGIGTSLVVAWFKKQFDAELEEQKALLQRGSRVHEKQIDALLDIYSRLERANFFLQRATSSILLAGETKEGLVEGTVKELIAAAKLYGEKKLLIPLALAQKLDEFFGAFHSARIDLSFAMWEMTPPGPDKAKLWSKAQDAAYQRLPPLLGAIENEARRTIHSE
jgi:hypothetical protein